MAVNFSESQTRINLLRAFAGESQARNRYTYAANKAKNMQYWFIYNIFNFTANQEKEHGEILYNHLKGESGTKIEIDNASYPIDNFDQLEQILRAAQNDEYDEANVVYPEFARIARDEGFTEIAFSFEKLAEIEKVHGDRFGCFAELIEKSKLFEGDDNTEWICLNCGHIHKGKTAPKQCPVCQHAQGYFVPFKYYHFVADCYGNAAQ